LPGNTAAGAVTIVPSEAGKLPEFGTTPAGHIENGPGPGTGAGAVKFGVKPVVHPLGWMMRLVSNVTAPLRDKALPQSVAPVCMAIEVRAMMFPTNVVVVAMVAELLTCQKMSHG
jgi:hypothetical protein